MAQPITELTSVTITSALLSRLQQIARQRHVTANRVIVDLLEDAIDAYDKRRAAFLELTEQFQRSTDPAETETLREKLIQMTFGG
jgi:predicted transcriptional regulator